MCSAFYERYFLQLLQEVLAVLTDTMHKSGFKLQAAILLSLIHSVEVGEIVTPLAPTQQVRVFVASSSSSSRLADLDATRRACRTASFCVTTSPAC